MRTKKQYGQVMPVLLLVVLAVLIVAVVSYNASRATVSKMELINAADGAAYSGALQTARSMNFMAYTSRGMISNTIASGYMVAYVSHLRHLAAGIDELTRPKELLAKVAKFALGAVGEQIESLIGFGSKDTEGRFADPMTEPLLDPNAPRSEDFLPDAERQQKMQNEANQTQQANQSISGNKFQRAGRFGGAALDLMATTIGYGTIPLTDLLNTSYAGIQLAEYAAIKQAITGTMAQVAEGYGDNIVLEDDNADDVYAWMLPIRPGMDGFGLKIPKTFKFDLGNHLARRAAKTGNPIGVIAGQLSKLAFSALSGQGALRRDSSISLSPMKILIGGSNAFDSDERFMVWERAWRACFQMLPAGMVPLAPIPLNPGADDRLDVYVTPPCTPPFVAPALPGMAQMALDKTGGASFIIAQDEASESGLEIMRKRGISPKNPAGVPEGQQPTKEETWEPPGNPYEDEPNTGRGPTRGPGLWGVLPGNPYEEGAQVGSASLTPAAPQSGTIEQQADLPENRARRSGSRTDRKYTDLSALSPMRQAVKQTQKAITEQFRNRLYSSSVGQKSGASGLSKILGGNPLWGADWQSEDKIEMGAFIWRPKFQPAPPFLDITGTLLDSGFNLEGNELAWGGATAKEFWPAYQGVPLYMALMELPWTDGLSFGLEARKNGRVIEVEVSRPISDAQLSLGFMDPPEAGDFRATAWGEVFYYRQPGDNDNPDVETGGSVYGYFPRPGKHDSPRLSPFASVLTDAVVTGDVAWYKQMQNWYGQKWASTQIAMPIAFDVLKPAIGISKELPNLLTPFWDARLTQL